MTSALVRDDDDDRKYDDSDDKNEMMTRARPVHLPLLWIPSQLLCSDQNLDGLIK